MTFWGGSGSGSADPCLWLMDPDPDADPDPAFSSLTFPRCQQKLFFLKVFLLITFWGYMYIIFKDKKSKRSHKAVGIKVFLTFFLLGDGRIYIRIHTSEWWIRIQEAQKHVDPVDSDPGSDPQHCICVWDKLRYIHEELRSVVNPEWFSPAPDLTFQAVPAGSGSGSYSLNKANKNNCQNPGSNTKYTATCSNLKWPVSFSIFIRGFTSLRRTWI